ncbi:MAG: hypothetical protein AB7R89_21145 [Dehalococcoidia bacterium]
MLLLAACSRGEDSAERALTPTPTLFVATATVPGISGPPQTPQASEPPRSRTRAEAFLRRIAPTDADLPPGFAKPETAFKDGGQLAEGEPDPTTAKSRWDRSGLVLAYESGFESEAGGTSPADGTVQTVTHTGYAFATPEGAAAWFDEAAGGLEPAIRALIDGQTGDIRAEQISDLTLGDEAVAWRVSRPSEAVGWVIAVRRGAGGFALALDGTGPAVDRLARDLATRLDQRLAAAAGAWP